ncbi:MAG: fumarylacetoacetate hydrolase family protein [Anaerolineae bacterium]|nr:MAG: fumarylacetoacetate hydrolase family protein [Anaerolineae bacterium]
MKGMRERCCASKGLKMARIVRFLHNNQVEYGLLEEDSVHQLSGEVYGNFEQGSRLASYADLKLLSPCMPTKIVAVGSNYRGHITEVGAKVPDAPILFLKPPSSVIGPGDAIVMPATSTEIMFEAELAVVMKIGGRHIPQSKVVSHVLGYTCANDVTANDLARVDPTVTRAKGFDTFCQLGPCIATDLSAEHLTIRSFVNGRVRQDSSSRDMLVQVSQLVSYVSQVMTLEAGDVILTGTPAGADTIRPGDLIEVEIEGIGTLANRAIAESTLR